MSVGEWLTVDDVARHLFGESTVATNARVRRLIHSETLAARKIGRQWRVHQSVLAALAHGGDDPSVMSHPDNRAATA